MIVEVTGASGAGKSTYINNLIDFLDSKGVATGAIHSVGKNYCSMIPDYFSDLSKHNIKTDLAALPWCCLLLFAYPRFFFFVNLRILKTQESALEKVAILRSFIRKAGIFRYLKQRKFRSIVIVVDEGLFHSSHNFLCSPRRHSSSEEVSAFFELCPRPEKLIILTASKESRLRRLLERGDLSPRVKGVPDLIAFVGHSQKLFRFLRNLSVMTKFGCVVDNDLDEEFSQVKLGAEYIEQSQGELL